MRFDWLNTEICVTILHEMLQMVDTRRNVARNVAEVGRNSTAAILRATILGVDTRCNLAIARNIAPCIRTLTIESDPRLTCSISEYVGEMVYYRESYIP